MTHYYNTNHTAKASALHRALLLVICFILSSTSTSFAQTIGGNVFGGGNQGSVGQSSTVEINDGTIVGNIFGGGNMAGVEQYTSVTISGGKLNNNVYGAGNLGNVGQSSTVTLKGGTIKGYVYGGACEANVGGHSFVDVNATSTLLVSGVYGGNDVSGTIGKSDALPFTPKLSTEITTEWNSFVRIANNTHPVIIGSLYGGGNGAYDVYTGDKTKPELGKTYLEIQGGIFGNIYGGGNNATVTGNTVIYMNNQLSSLSVSEAILGDFKDLFDATDYSTNGENITFNHHVSRMFGGNNLATMSIRPTWNLIKGSINNLYSGGNRGAMTAEDGISLTLANAGLTVNNVYGGCRMADVNPSKMTSSSDGYAAHVRIDAGTINNVYGGNDISGKVNYGTKVEIFSNITGDVYGGGNGSYAYTDKETTSDYYYTAGNNSIEALFNFRPHIEKTLIHVAGNDANNPVTIGSVYCGGNSATLYKEDGNATATFQIGKNINIGNVFLGSNGENMVTDEMLEQYANNDYNTITLTEEDQLERYMEGVAVNIVPTIEWDNGLDYSTRIGSFFCGGNVGSMTYNGLATLGNTANTLTFPDGIVIYDKIVAGCNNANVTVGNYTYVGGLVGDAEANTNDKVHIKVLSRLEPTTSNVAVSYQNSEGNILESNIYQGANVYGGCYESGIVNGNVIIDIESDIVSPTTYMTDGNMDANKAVILKATGEYINASSLAIYGGGYGSGTSIKGNTTINLTGNARILKVFGGGEMGSVTGNTTVNLDANLEYANNVNAYKVYAGGYAGDVEGNTTLNLHGGSVMTAFAGACNANIGGATKVIIGAGTPGVPSVAESVYGGNDFGGTIEGSNLYTVKFKNGDKDSTKHVRSQTYVQYNNGKIGRAIYGGSYGSYEYTHAIYGNLDGHTYPTINATISKQDGDTDETILTNTFVDIASTSTSSDDIIGSDNSESVLTMIAGGGRGYKGLPEYVEIGQTYLLLHGATYANRNNQLMAHRVYGGGNLSKVGNTRIDAYSGSYGQIFGGTHGVKTEADGDLNATYDCANTTINYYGTMGSANMNLFGTGANSGATGTATINLYAGNVGNVYGGSFAEGYTAVTRINVPNSSNKVIANAIFGGALGESEGRPCDVGVSNVVFASAIARVNEGIYGGNHTARATKETNVTINVPVKNQYENLLSIYGAGYGAGTVAGFTKVTLNAGAEVANVYGGGREGRVYNVYNFYDNTTGLSQYSNHTNKYAHWEIDNEKSNTLIQINGSDANNLAHVTGNVYGAGLGIENPQTKANANTRGTTKVHLNGGTVDGDIYGGGFAGTMLSAQTETSNDEVFRYDENIGSLCVIDGGQVRNVFGGGYQGNIEGNSGVDIGTKTGTTFYAGVPTILRSAYGGGEMAKVSGTSTVNMYNGYIGYRYDANSTVTNEKDKYIPELKLNADDEANLLKENGNLYGAGFGEGAVVMNTVVNLYGGIVRNGVYGGGEIAAVGDGTYNSATQKYTITKGGQTNVKMYGGLVVGDVFGGGRGFSYDLTGNQVIGKTLYSDGYVFGKTKVEIYRGTIGTDASLAEGHGNVFGGGNIGYVYSAGQKYTGTTSGTMINGHYYHKSDDPSTDIVETTAHRTEDCCVRISVNCLVTADAGVTISNNKHFAKGEYVPTEYLNTLAANDPIRSSLDGDGVVTADAGVTISNNKHFAKGEYVPTEYLNTLAAGDTRWDSLDDDGVTIRNAVFAGGNVSAGSDLVYANAVTVYGNATASVIDAFSRDLVILGGEHIGGLYGDGNLTFVDGYRELNITNYGTDYYHLKNKDYSTVTSEREKAYYMYDDLNSRWVINSTSGRTMNTIQRADFCGVFGCRILLHGAQDRVPDVVDYTNYTINRVGEVSLNGVTKNSVTHGNYFGIYNVVNLLGAFTSDVEFSDVRTAKEDGNDDHKYDDDTNCNYGTATYSQFKSHYLNTDYRNDGKSHNMVALASGVYLELVKDYDSNGNKIYGPVTGVIELDLINVTTGEGGGYVYAKNEHGTANSITEDKKKHLTLSDANKGAITQAAYTYGAANAQSLMQTSGNFVHPEKRIGDDCFPKGGDYREPVHFWYVCGTSYVYDQHISAYTGAARPYEQSINIPLTIANGSDGKIKLISITHNKYYTGATALKYGNKTYQPFDPITIKEFNELPTRHQTNFTEALYVAQCDVWTANGGKYSLEDKISQEQYTSLGTLYSDAGKTTTIRKEDAFCIGNEMSHENGYMLTFEMSNPKVWGAYYTHMNNSSDKKKEEEYLTLDNKQNYIKAPTIRCNISGIYGQQSYQKEELVNQTVITKQNAIVNGEQAIKEAYALIQSTQAVFQEAYIAINNVYVDGTTYIAGNYISKGQYDSSIFENYRVSFKPAYICVNTIEVADKEFLFPGDLISSDRYQELAGKTSTDDTYMAGISITDYFSPAYVCTKAGNYGGTYFKANQNYDALDICELPKTERNKVVGETPVFEFNHDALDLFDTYDAPYDEEQYVDFTAAYEYTGNAKTLYNKVYNSDGTYTGNVTQKTIQSGDILQREDFQLLLNEQAHYIPVVLAAGNNYIVKKELSIGNTTYHIGQTIKESDYTSLTEDQKNTYIHVININTNATETRYICFESYHKATINDSGASAQTETDNIVAEGTIIIKDAFDALPNSQEDFVITGLAAIETSTLFVPRGSDIRNLGVDRIVTVELEYKYKDRRPDFSFEEKLEKHVVNIHIQFKSGQPSIGEVIAPAVVLPNSTVGLSVPTVTPGAYEIIGGGWEIFKNETDAKNHKNGEPYINNATPMYWYQNDYYVAYYAKTYLGKAYSNPVPFTIANYHRLGEVMNHPEYMYIDHEEVKRAPKIYLDAAEYPNASIAAGKGEKNDLDYFAELYNATLDANKLEGRVKGCANLEFILRSDIAPKAAWTAVGSESVPFAGKFHGNGYTISGLNNASLFEHLGGKVYNLGVNGGNIASTMANGGRIENAWVSTTGTSHIISGDNVVNYHFFTNANAASFAKGEVAYTLNSFYAPNVQYNANGYVENYFADGDFIYAGGTIPLDKDVRLQHDGKYKPLADDYIFFGQRLTYDNVTHESLPNRINKVGNWIDRTASSDRVYRASAYYMNNTESDIFFNTDAKFVDTYDSKHIHHNLTAIDFTDNDADMEQLLGFSLDGLTKNLLVYAENVADNPTYGIVSSYLTENTLSISTDGYKTVAKNPVSSRGHFVTKDGNSYVALTDHFLVDKENFNAPIAYKFASDKRMWYQREPEDTRFANRDGKGWDVVCLPFTANLVTTHQKGEITHFYQGSTTNHEYWLREFEEVSTKTSDGQTSTTATFASPAAVEDNSYTRYNDFLSDYYYSKYNDKNDDTYQDYYKNSETFAGYAYLQANTPYIIAFPGQTYHEFDMSGNFVPEHTATSIGKLDKQVVTFVSGVGATIGVTDDATTLVKTANGFDFVGTYQTKDIKDINGYLINAEGSAFVKANAESSVPFRGYLTTPTIGDARKIFIGAAAEEDEPQDDVDNRGITVYGRRGGIYIESTLEDETVVTIYRLNGQLVQKVAVQPMGKVFVPVALRGIYIVNRQKVSVL